MNEEPTIVKYDIYTYGPDGPEIVDYDLLHVINQNEPAVASVASVASAVVGVGGCEPSIASAAVADTDDL